MTNYFQDFSSPSAVFRCYFPTWGNSIALKRMEKELCFLLNVFTSSFLGTYEFEIISDYFFQTSSLTED